jgi:hypothetical protein
VFSKKKNLVPQERGIYAFTKYRKGEFILYIEEQQDCYRFMQLPDRYEIFLTKEEYTEGVASKLFDFIEQIPEDVFEVSKANIEKFEKLS